MIDILFCALPYSNLDHIYSAPAILKGVVVEHGYTAKTVDFGSELFSLCNMDVDLFTRVQQYFISNKVEDSTVLTIIDQFYNNIIEYLKNNRSRYIGISVFSLWTHKTAWELLTRIKQENFNSKIVVGGRGVSIKSYKIFNDLFNLSNLEQNMFYGKILEKRKLVDHVVAGDGEDAILSILSNCSTQINCDTNMHSELFKSPVPDYSDYNFSLYRFGDQEICWPITGSKGCVRDCDFCDVAKQFGKYRYRSGEDIANEMIAVANKNGARKFMFSDSLVNGGLKPFKEFLQIIANYNDQHPEQQIRWSGQYICRPDVPEEIYSLIKRSGGEGLTIGAESGSNSVLRSMNKKTTVEALMLELEQFRKYNLSCVLLLMVGHWAESWNDFVDHCKMIVKIAPYVRTGNISAVHVGFPMIMHDQTPAWENRDENQVILSDFDPGQVWYSGTNPSNTIKERVFRQLITAKICKKLRIPLVDETEDYLNSLSALEANHKKIAEFYQTFGIDLSKKSTGETTLEHFDNFFNSLIEENKLTFEFVVTAHECNGPPILEITNSNNIIYNQSLNAGAHTINLLLDTHEHNKLEIRLTNKDTSIDTKVLDGKIVEDKFIEINSLKINNIDLFNDPEFFYNYFACYDQDNISTNVKPGFWQNSTLTLEYPKFFQSWYHSLSNKNISLGSGLAYRSISDSMLDSVKQKLLQLSSFR